MVAPPRCLTAVAAFLPLLSFANAKLSQELRDRKLPDCEADTQYSQVPDMGKFWYNSGAEKFADDYINDQADHTTWAKNLLRELLPDNQYDAFGCETTGATCSLPRDLCTQLNEIDKGGLYYLFISLEKFHTYMTKIDHELSKKLFAGAMQVGEIQDLLNIPSGEDSGTTPNVFGILGSAAGIVGGFSGPLGPYIGAASGLFGIMSTYGPQKDAKNADFRDASETAINSMIGGIAEEVGEAASRLIGTVFGTNKTPQSQIPEVMRRGGVNNPAVSILGWGAWLGEDSFTMGAEEFAKRFKDKVNQSLLWQMGRFYKKLYVVIRDDIDQEECDGPHISSVWDEEKSRCLDLFSWDTGDKSTLGGANDFINNDVWNKWDMDPLVTMRNAVDCWEEHNGHVGEAKPATTWDSALPPPCFFPMEVVKGTYSDANKGVIDLDGDYEGQFGLGDHRWPAKKACKVWRADPTTCDFEWVGDDAGK